MGIASPPPACDGATGSPVNHHRQAFGSFRKSKIAAHRVKWTVPALTKEWAMLRLTRIIRCDRGANAIEYALVASLIAIAAYGAMEAMGNKIDTMYNNVSNHL
jgi:pilus assembly protein Flp/PilA